MFLNTEPSDLDKRNENRLENPSYLTFGAIQENSKICSSSNYNGILNGYVQNNTDYYKGNSTITVECH